MTEHPGPAVQPAAEHAHAVMHCNLNTPDAPAAESFYTGLFDLTARMRSVETDGDATAMGLGTGTSSVTVFLYDRRGPRSAPALELVGWERPPVAPRPPGDDRPGLTALGYRVPVLADVRDRLAAAGRAFAEVADGLPVRGRTAPALRCTDDDGVVVEVVEVAAAPDDPPAAALSHLRVVCRDLARSTAWYAALGWAVRARGADGAGPTASLVLPEDPTFSLELEQRPTRPGEPLTATTRGLYRIALAVDDVRAAHAALAARGDVPEPVFMPMPDVPTGGFTVLFLADPDATVVELVERPRSEVRRPLEPR